MNQILKKLSLYIFVLVEFLLIVRFVFKLVGASDDLNLVKFVYQNTQVLLSPFLLAFPSPNTSGQYILEFTTLFAIFVYAFLSYLIGETLDFLESKK